MLLNLKKREGQFGGIVVNANLPIIRLNNAPGFNTDHFSLICLDRVYK